MLKKMVLMIGVLSVVCLAADTNTSEGDLAAMISRADKILAKGVVEAAKEVDEVFLAAVKLRELGQLDKAEKYYSEGLMLSPRNMNFQLEYAELLAARGDKAGAVKAAEIVYSIAEQQDLLERAAVVLGQKLPDDVPLLPDGNLEKMSVCFVKVGPVDDWLVQAAGRKIRETLGCPVYQFDDMLVPGDADRSLIERVKESVKQDINWSHPGVIKYLKDKSISAKEQVTGRQAFDILLNGFKSENNTEAYDSVLNTLKYLEARDKQWDANNLIRILVVRGPVRDNLIVVGITACDIFGGDSNYFFGNAINSPKCCIVSSCRFSERYYAKPDNQELLIDRLHKQLLSSIGFTLSIPRSKDPRTARSYPGGIQEHDSKGSWLSEDCIKGFEAGLGHALPEATKEQTRKMLNKVS